MAETTAEQAGYPSLSYVAYHTLRRDIIYCDLKPGQKLSVRELEERFGLGRTPVREALVRLSELGLVYTIPQSGTYVSRIDLQRAEDARFMREHLESSVIMECCARLTDEGRASLERVIDEQEQAVASGDARAFFEHDNEFHELIFKIAGRHTVWSTLEAHNTHLQRFRWLRTQVKGLEWDTIMSQHHQMLEAITSHDPEEANFLSIAHAHLLFSEYLAVTDAFPDYFDRL